MTSSSVNSEVTQNISRNFRIAKLVTGIADHYRHPLRRVRLGAANVEG